jgi:hypothetical protein
MGKIYPGNTRIAMGAGTQKRAEDRWGKKAAFPRDPIF